MTTIMTTIAPDEARALAGVLEALETGDPLAAWGRLGEIEALLIRLCAVTLAAEERRQADRADAWLESEQAAWDAWADRE